MKLRHFLTALLSFIALPLFARIQAFKPSPPKLKFYWIGEESEVFVAPSLEALNVDYGTWDDEDLTPANEGVEWGYVDAKETVFWEDGGDEITYEQAVERMMDLEWFRNRPVAQLGTSYY